MEMTHAQYGYYVKELKKAKRRMSRDRMIIKHVQKIVNTKNLAPSDEEKLNSLIAQKVT